MFLFSDSPQNKSQIFNANFLISAYIRSGQMNNHQIALNNDANSSPSSMEQTFSMDGGNRTDNTTFEWEQNEFHTSFVDDFFIDPNIVSLIYLSYMPICCGIGLTGNAMVWILIRSNRLFKKLPSSAYIIALSIMSSLFLLSLLSFWVEESFIRNSVEIQTQLLLVCKFATFIAHFCDFASVWLIVLIVFERLTLLYHFTKRRSISQAKKHVYILLLLSFLANVWILFVAEVGSNGGDCDIRPEYENIYHTFSLFETIACMFIPSAIILNSNILVILKLRSHMKKIPASPMVSFNMADTVYSTGPTLLHTIKFTKLSKAGLGRSRNGSTSARGTISGPIRLELRDLARRMKRKNALRYTDLQLTRSLLVITTVFIALNLPNYAYRIGIQFFHISDNTSLMQCLSFAAHVFLYTHHAILFYTYIFNSPQMRKRLLPIALKLLECYCIKPAHQQHDFSGEQLFQPNANY